MNRAERREGEGVVLVVLEGACFLLNVQLDDYECLTISRWGIQMRSPPCRPGWSHRGPHSWVVYRMFCTKCISIVNLHLSLLIVIIHCEVPRRSMAYPGPKILVRSSIPIKD